MTVAASKKTARKAVKKGRTRRPDVHYLGGAKYSPCPGVIVDVAPMVSACLVARGEGSTNPADVTCKGCRNILAGLPDKKRRPKRRRKCRGCTFALDAKGIPGWVCGCCGTGNVLPRLTCAECGHTVEDFLDPPPDFEAWKARVERCIPHIREVDFQAHVGQIAKAAERMHAWEAEKRGGPCTLNGCDCRDVYTAKHIANVMLNEHGADPRRIFEMLRSKLDQALPPADKKHLN